MVGPFRSYEDRHDKIYKLEIPASQNLGVDSRKQKVRGKGKSFDCTLNKMAKKDSFILKSKTKFKDAISKKQQHYELFKPSMGKKLPARSRASPHGGSPKSPTPKKQSPLRGPLRVPLVASAQGLATSKRRMPMLDLDAPKTGEFVIPRNGMSLGDIKKMTGLQHVVACGPIPVVQNYKV